MGKWDTNCAICGTVAGRYYHEECDLREGLEEDEVDWTTDVRVIGVNSTSTLLDKTFVSGRAGEPSMREFPLEAGVHPNDPVASGQHEIQCYDQGSPSFPFHVLCLEKIFSSVLHYNAPELDNTGQLGKWGNISISQLYRCMRDLWTSDMNGYLNKIYYGAIQERWDGYGQGFMYEEGDQDFVANPIRYKDINWEQWTGSMQDAPPPMGEPSTDAASHLLKMPLDILYEIFLRLDLEWVASLQKTCRMFSRLPFPRWYWLQRVKVDFPYLQDSMERLWNLPSESLDWQQVHHGLCGVTARKSSTRIPGLVNRARMWDVCQNIVAEYLAYPDVHGQLVNILGSAYDRVSVQRMPVVGAPDSGENEEFVVFLGEAPNFVPHGSLEISARFSDDGLISNMHFMGAACDAHLEVEDEEDESEDDDDALSNAQNTIQLSSTDVFEQIILVSRESGDRAHGVTGVLFKFTSGNSMAIGTTEPNSEGEPLCKRILKVKNGHRLIGFQGSMLPGCTISRFGLIEIETDSEPVFSGSSTGPVIDSTDGIQTVRWSGHPPIDETSLSRVHLGVRPLISNMGEFARNLTYKHVDFVKPDWNLEEISVDMQLRGIELQFRSTSETVVRRFGPRFEEYKTIRLDYQNGEHMVAVAHEVNYGQNPRILRICTSHNRQLVCGSPEQEKTRWFEKRPDYSLSGLYCVWLNYPHGAELLAFGITQLPSGASRTVAQHTDGELTDEEGAIWEPCPPPSGWKPQGTIIGVDPSEPRDGRRRASVVSWLDFSRPLDTIRFCFTHSQEEHLVALSLVGVSVSFNNGRSSRVGLLDVERSPAFLNWPEPPTLTTSCVCGSRDQVTSHWRFEEFEPQGVRIRSLRVWSNTEIYALQLTLENDRESPIWGDATKGTLYEFAFGDGHHRGIKFSFWSLHRSSGIKDLSVAAIQGLG